MRSRKQLSSLLMAIFIFGMISFQSYDAKAEVLYIETQTAYKEQLILDPNFNENEGSTPWNNNSEGDISDMDVDIGGGSANITIVGDQGTFSLESNPPFPGWTATQNPNFPYYPDTYVLNASGASVSHDWREGADQSVAVNWERNVSMPVNMSDYIITTASISALVNGTVIVPSSQPPQYSDGIEAGNDLGVNTSQYATGDYVRFYVLISDLPKNNVYEIASNQTTDLGQDWPIIDQMGDTLMMPVTEESLIFYLTSVLNEDNYNFTVTIGMRIWCEDNYAQDSDVWELLIIKSVNLTFTYEKKIDQFNSISLTQTSNAILSSDYDVPNSTVLIGIDEATLNFKYKVDQNWSDYSPNSEFRIYINNTKLSETLKLTEGNSTWQNATVGGFDVSSLVFIDNNISLSLQVYLADEFLLNENSTIWIDDVYLNVSFTVTVQTDKIETDLKKVGSLSVSSAWNDSFVVDLNYTEKNTSIGILNAKENFTIDWVDSYDIQEIGGGIYQLTCDNTNTISGQTYSIEISVDKFGYLQNSLQIEVNILERDTEIEIFMEETNMTFSPVIELPITEILNLTARYFDSSYSTPIENATASLYGILEANYIYTQEGDAHQFIIDTLKIGLGTHLISLVLENQNFYQISTLLRITVVPIQMSGTIRDDIQSVSITPGSDFLLEIQLRDEFGDLVQNIEVNYTWDGAPGTFTYNETSGYYTALLSDVPEGVFDIIITAEKGPNYDFEEYRITISSSTKLSVWQLVLIYFLAALIIALISGFGAYQLHYKYPPMVRDVRNLRRKLRKGRKTKSVLIDSREKIMDKIFQDKLRDSNIKSIKVKKIDKKAEKIVRTDEDIKKIADKDSIKKVEKPETDKKLPEKIKEKEKVEKVPDKKMDKKIADQEKKLKEKAEREKITKDKAAKKDAKKEKRLKEKTAEKEKSVMEKIAKEAAEKAKKIKESPVKVGKKEEAKVKMSKISLPKKKDKKK